MYKNLYIIIWTILLVGIITGLVGLYDFGVHLCLAVIFLILRQFIVDSNIIDKWKSLLVVEPIIWFCGMQITDEIIGDPLRLSLNEFVWGIVILIFYIRKYT